jgi:hypothetical protein
MRIKGKTCHKCCSILTWTPVYNRKCQWYCQESNQLFWTASHRCEMCQTVIIHFCYFHFFFLIFTDKMMLSLKSQYSNRSVQLHLSIFSWSDLHPLNDVYWEDIKCIIHVLQTQNDNYKCHDNFHQFVIALYHYTIVCNVKSKLCKRTVIVSILSLHCVSC